MCFISSGSGKNRKLEYFVKVIVKEKRDALNPTVSVKYKWLYDYSFYKICNLSLE